MSLHYFLDGYNIIHRNQMPVSVRSKLEDQRRQLIQWIESRSPQGSLRNAVTVVFDSSMAPDSWGLGQEAPLRINPERSRRVDGRSDVWSSAAGASSVRVVFAQGESADEKIVRLVEEQPHRKNIVVVTDDRALQRAVRALGAVVSSVAEFAGKERPAREQAGTQPRKPEAGKNISKTLEYKITSEMSRVWLDKEKREK